ncbi:hypothetical protein DBR11_05370 [Pedobacter sp. HMWF019]|uniref:hypothetical protein n=1 Tax=Pedobacter sp. HMWF019 TaxID=2056856 RepID=UPI000D3DA704|nr:hypothetical protein [Pedobacter sp. HMWF019]PTT02137.1 hypothetical protein DBR11_05370 [Pedobacter sp. HMWF019]
MKKNFLLLFTVILCLFSCKKDSPDDPLSGVVFNKEGVLRVECNQCVINYTISDQKANAAINSGSKDLSFTYLDGAQLKTQLLSKEDQTIRMMVIDASGKIISNELKDLNQGQIEENTFNIKGN